MTVAGVGEADGPYLVLCRMRSNGIALWWGPNRCGYYENIDDAGRYTREEAESIVLASDRGEEMWPLSVVEAGKLRRIVDMGDSANAYLEQRRNRDWLIAPPPSSP
jgi:hypothetical protein